MLGLLEDGEPSVAEHADASLVGDTFGGRPMGVVGLPHPQWSRRHVARSGDAFIGLSTLVRRVDDGFIGSFMLARSVGDAFIGLFTLVRRVDDAFIGSFMPARRVASIPLTRRADAAWRVGSLRPTLARALFRARLCLRT